MNNEKSSKTSVSQNDLRSSPFVSDLYCHLSQHSPPSTPSHHRQHSVARLLKLKTKARIKQQLAEQEKLSQTLPQLHNSDSLNDTIDDNLDLDDGDTNRANIESSNSLHPISSSSFFLHDSQKSMTRNKQQRPSSASAERPASVLDISGGGHNRRDEFSEPSNMTNVSVGGEKQKRVGENSAALRKESRLLSLSSSFLSSSNESNGQQKFEEKLATVEKSCFTPATPPTRPESGMRRQIQMLNSKIPQRKSNFDFSSFSSCEGNLISQAQVMVN